MKPIIRDRWIAFGVFFPATWAALIIMLAVAHMAMTWQILGGLGVVSMATALLISTFWPDGGQK